MRVAATVGGNGAKEEPVAAVDGEARPSFASLASFDQQQARLGILSEAMGAFAEATGDPARVIDTVARRVAEVIHDYCVVLLVSDDGLRVEPAAVFDPDPGTCRRLREALSEPLLLERHASVREVLELDPATTGEPVARGEHHVHVVVEKRCEDDAGGRGTARPRRLDAERLGHPGGRLSARRHDHVHSDGPG